MKRFFLSLLILLFFSVVVHAEKIRRCIPCPPCPVVVPNPDRVGMVEVNIFTEGVSETVYWPTVPREGEELTFNTGMTCIVYRVSWLVGVKPVTADVYCFEE